jgi:DnaK suppressor protein
MKPSEKLPAGRRPDGLPDDDKVRREQLNLMLDRLRIQEIQRARALRDRDLSAPGDEADCAVSEDDADLSTWLADVAASRRAAVENALRRVEGGGYGLCEECGDEIAPERLCAVPTAVLCVDCQQASETSSKRMVNEQPPLWITAGNSWTPPRASEEGGADSANRTGGPRRRGNRRRQPSDPAVAVDEGSVSRRR